MPKDNKNISDKNRRNYVRLDANYNIKFSELSFPVEQDTHQITAISKDLSGSGLLFDSDIFVEIGTTLKINFNIPSFHKHKQGFLSPDWTSTPEKCTVIAEVVRIKTVVMERQYEVAVKFVDIYSGDQEALVNFINSKL